MNDKWTCPKGHTELFPTGLKSVHVWCFDCSKIVIWKKEGVAE